MAQSLPLPPPLPPSPTPPSSLDAREVGRVVATLLLASGSPTQEEVARANAGLAQLGRPVLGPHDADISTPEELAPRVPLEMRAVLAELCFDLAGADPIRLRLARTYAALWELGREARPASEAGRGKGHLIARLLIGALPRHHETEAIAQERELDMMQGVYRSTENKPHLAPSARDPLRLRIERIHDEYLRVVDAVEKAFIGKRSVVERALTAMTARGHVLFVDNPGVGKTLLCKAISAACGMHFGRVQFTPDLLPMDLTGAAIYEPHNKCFVFRPGPIFTHLLLADEINRATPKTQSALLEVMEERTVTVDGTTHRMAEPFQVLATMNPLDHEGTFALPAAQMDRFMVMIELGYPSPDDEVRVLDAHLSPDPALASIAPVLSSEAFLDWQKTTPLVHATPEIKRIAVDLVNGLRKGAEPGHLVSPRATLAWMRAAQARALLSGREFVTVKDLLDLGPDVLRHRLWISAEEVRDRLRALVPSIAAGQSSAEEGALP
jgi:MoxR-like ATPase